MVTTYEDVLDRVAQITRELREIIEFSTCGRDTMLYVGGSNKSFRCHCGANVFKPLVPLQDGVLRYRCNGCGECYTGER